MKEKSIGSGMNRSDATDTARHYNDTLEKLGLSLHHVVRTAYSKDTNDFRIDLITFDYSVFDN